MDQQLQKLADTPWLGPPLEPGDDEVGRSRPPSSGALGTLLPL